MSIVESKIKLEEIWEKIGEIENKETIEDLIGISYYILNNLLFLDK